MKKTGNGAQLRLDKRVLPSHLHHRIARSGEGDAMVKAGGEEEVSVNA
jgi:hypothetical protein